MQAALLRGAQAAGSGPAAGSGGVAGFTGFGESAFAPPQAVGAAGASPGRVAGITGSAPSSAAAPRPFAGDVAADMVRGNVELTPLSRAFFSASNVAIVQNLVRFRVYERSGRVIDPQSPEELLTVMRATFLQGARHLPNREREEIARMNESVAAWAAPRIEAEMGMHARYLQELDSMPVPLAHPVHMSGAGTKSQPFKRPG